MNKLILACGLALLTATSAMAAEVSETTRINAPLDKVWRLVKPFCSVAQWHPAVDKCELRSQNGKQERVLAIKGGGVIEERLLATSSAGHSVRYSILNSPLPVKDYVSTMTLSVDGAGTKVVWGSRFTPVGDEAAAKKAVSGIYTSGFDGMKKALGAQ
jgi:hypothetical protein